MTNFNKLIKPYLSLIKANVALFSPLLEVAIHDLNTGKIAAIYGQVTKRRVGDISPIKGLKVKTDKFPEFFEPYYEISGAGHKIKCTTITIRDDKHQAVALICYNFDVSFFQDIQDNLQTLLEVKTQSNNPVELFGHHWQEKIDQQIANYLSRHNLRPDGMTRDEKLKLLDELSKHGVFFLKNAAVYIAAKLDISRATIYNYLKILRAAD